MKLPSVLDLAAATTLRTQLMELRGQKVDIDAAAVERLGGLCLQVLIAARNQWRVDGVDFQIVNPSPALLDGARLMAAEELVSQGGVL